MKPRYLWILSGLILFAGIFGYLKYQDTLVPIPLASEQPLFVPAAPEYGQDEALLEALLPAGEKAEAFLENQSDLTLLERGASGELIGQLLSDLAVTRHGRRWQLKVREGWHLQGGGSLDGARLAQAIGPAVARKGGELRVSNASTVELRFSARPLGLLAELGHWRVPGTGPFLRHGSTLKRFDGFIHGRAGMAGLELVTDPALLESRAWAQGMVAGRWAFTVFPGAMAPEDMAKVRLAPYDELRMGDGTVWFLSRRLRRLRPRVEDWPRTRLFGAWKGAMDLPYDPLGM
jgi:hypothetical protein